MEAKKIVVIGFNGTGRTALIETFRNIDQKVELMGPNKPMMITRDEVYSDEFIEASPKSTKRNSKFTPKKKKRKK